MKKNRNKEIDILKAIGILCMVGGHAGGPYLAFINLFHMAIFFMASGFFYKPSSADSIKSVLNAIVRKGKQLWFPFVIWNSIFVIFHNIFLKVNIYTDNPDILNYPVLTGTTSYYSVGQVVFRVLKGIWFSSQEQMFGAFWFIKVLFMVSVSYLAVDFLLIKINPKYEIVGQLSVSVILLAIGYTCSLYDIKFSGLEQMASFYCLYFVGYIIGKYQDKFIKWNLKQYIPCFIVSFICLVLLGKIGTDNFSDNKYINPVFLLASSIAGWIMVYSLAYFLKLIPVVNTIMVEIGKRTLTILILHFLSFKLVTFCIVKYYDLPDYLLASFPRLYADKGRWCLYSIVGICIPLLLNIIYRSVMDKFKKRA